MTGEHESQEAYYPEKCLLWEGFRDREFGEEGDCDQEGVIVLELSRLSITMESSKREGREVLE